MIPRGDIDGLVLAGGRSRRMRAEGGPAVDKGLLMLDGAPLVQWVAQYMKPWVGDVYISANRRLDVYGRYGHCISDDPEFGGDAGPLAGVASVMARSRRPWLLVLPVDVPRLPTELPTRLIEAVGGGAPLAYACAGTKAHPLCMLVRRDLVGDLRTYLLDGGRKVLDWHRRHDAVPVDFGDGPDLFRNINTPDDWAQAGGTRIETEPR
ncbi:molybdenum cofactor guanylyltransferase MobA [Pusillimonas sp.]|uniref:molybdenum cofactor guanylyltransferase MobA n=1 Tax=Pusillimonas sp. TaxID=3040095 RepID=UPI0029ABD3D4|nr:molybdenum cofactor guanylyltransferase MobA [Pusillimonas sp.]MDX3893904.1 molybdenum cofactor guanylyltransferase MobA [Pusillimonas sp.]